MRVNRLAAIHVLTYSGQTEDILFLEKNTVEVR